MAKFTLFLNPRSPFARRIRLALHRSQLPFNEKDVGNVFEPQSELWALNPLGMIPTLVTPENETFSDSANLLEYLDEKTGAIWPKDPKHRLHGRQAAVWCAGIMQSSVLYYQETVMHEPPTEYWVKEHLQSIKDTLAHLAQLKNETWVDEGIFTQAGWDLCVALEYADFRIPLQWRSQYEKFARLLDQARLDPVFIRTSIPKP